MKRLKLVELPNKPSVSRQITFKLGSYFAHTPKVQDICDEEVLNTSSPLKNTSFNVYDFPSPVLPNIDTTLTCKTLSLIITMPKISSIK